VMQDVFIYCFWSHLVYDFSSEKKVFGVEWRRTPPTPDKRVGEI